MPGGFLLAYAGAAINAAWAEPLAARDQHETRTAAAVAPIREGAFTNVQPIGLLSSAHAGVRLRAYFDDLYNQVYFIPAVLDFGTISGETDRDVVVWNAHLHPVTLTDVEPRNASGVGISGPARPRIFGALGTATYTIQAFDDPEITLDGWADFTFDPAESFSLKLIGTRAVLFPFDPNWRESYTVTLEFKTDVWTSTAGKEQRRALRQTPRKTLEFVATASRSKIRRLTGLLAKSQNNALLVPEATRFVHSVASMEPGASVMAVDGNPNWLLTGATVVLSFGERRETRQIEGVAAGQIQFTATGVEPWPTGTKVSLGLRGVLDSSITTDRYTNTAAEMHVKFLVNPGSELDVPVPAAPVVWNGREVWTLRPNWGEGAQAVFEHARNDVDYGQGRTALFTEIPFGTRTWTATFVGQDYASAELVREFYTRMKGRRGEFYMPTWDNDIDLQVPALAGSQVLRVSGLDFAREFKDDTVYRAVAVLLRNNTWLYNAVESVGEIRDDLGDDSAVQVADPWPLELNASTVKMISWMPVWGFGADSLTVEWLTASVAQMQIAMRTLEDQA